MSFIIDASKFDKNPLLSMLHPMERVKISKFKLHHKRFYGITVDDRFLVFGDNSEGLLGLGKHRGILQQPTELVSLSGKQVLEVAVGPGHCLVLTANGQLYGFGFNQFGQLGVGQRVNTFEPLLVMAGGIKAVRCGSQFSLALKENGRVLAWGSAKNGRLGCGKITNQFHPIEIVKLADQVVVDIQVGLWHSFALTNQGRCYGWGGSAFYQLGLARRNNASEPRAIDFCEEPIKMIRCGAFHSLFLTVSGQVYVTGLQDVTIRKLNFIFSAPIETIVVINYRFAVPKAHEDLLLAASADGQVHVWTNPLDAVVTFNDSMFDVLQEFAKYIAPNEMFTVANNNRLRLEETNIELLSSSCEQKPEPILESWKVVTSGCGLARKIAVAFHLEMDVDVEFYFLNQPEVLRAHRTVLTLSSDYMRNLLHHPTMVKLYHQAGGFIRVPVLNFNPRVFGEYLRFLYTSSIADLPIEDLIKLTQLATLVKDSELKVTCFGQFVKNTINVNNCCQMYAVCVEQDLPQMFHWFILTHICKHYEQVVQTQGFLTLSLQLQQQIHLNFVSQRSMQ